MAEVPIALSPPVENNPPEVRFDLGPEQAKVLRGIKPGSTIRLVLRGVVRSISLQESYNEDSPGYTGYVVVEARRMEFAKSNEEMESLLDD